MTVQYSIPYVLRELHKDPAESWDRAKDNDEPHFREDPDVQTCHGISVVLDVGNVLYRNPFHDCGAAGSVYGLS